MKLQRTRTVPGGDISKKLHRVIAKRLTSQAFIKQFSRGQLDYAL